VLLVAVVTFADGKGHWWPKVKTLAAAAGVSASTVKRALAEAESAGLIRREPYLRPDGTQGSSNYFLDPELVWPESYRQGGSGESHLVAPPERATDAVPVTRWVSPEPLTRWVSPEPPERSKNEGTSPTERGVDQGSSQVAHFAGDARDSNARVDETIASTDRMLALVEQLGAAKQERP
jgi:hypothetical protein